MKCSAREDSLLEYALGTLVAPELDELRAHLGTGCPICEGKLTESKAMLALLPLALPPVKPPQSARVTLLNRVGGDAIAAATAPMQLLQPKHRRNTWWISALAGAAAAACVTILVYSNILSTQNGQLQSAQNQLTATEAELKQAQLAAQDTREMLQTILFPSSKVVDLKDKANQPDGMARLVWDPNSHSLCVFASNLKPLPKGKGYELWLFNGGEAPVPAGTFEVTEQGEGMMHTQLPTDPGKVLQVAITAEPFNNGRGVPKPTAGGIVQFLQAIQ